MASNPFREYRTALPCWTSVITRTPSNLYSIKHLPTSFFLCFFASWANMQPNTGIWKSNLSFLATSLTVLTLTPHLRSFRNILLYQLFQVFPSHFSLFFCAMIVIFNHAMQALSQLSYSPKQSRQLYIINAISFISRCNSHPIFYAVYCWFEPKDSKLFF